MKSTTFIAILLTFLMLLLVAVAAAFFLWQGQQDLRSDLQLQQAEINGQEQMINELQNTAAAREMAQSTDEARVTALETELLGAQDQLATRDAELAEALATLQAEPEATNTPDAQPAPGQGPPPLEILFPTFGTTVSSDANLPIIVIAAAAEGIANIEVQVGDRPPLIETLDDDPSFAVFQRNIFNLQSGQLNITATVTTADGDREETSVRIFVNEAGAEESETE